MRPDLIKIFLVEDDQNFGAVLKVYLEMNDYLVEWVDDGNSALQAFQNGDFDICILDVMLPNIDGFTIAKGIKKLNAEIPLIFLTAKTLKQDELEGYRIGADDYIKKPFDSEILLYKIKAILRRDGSKANWNYDETNFVIGQFTFDYPSRTLTGIDIEKKLSPKEAELFKMLCINKNNILSREKALKAIWGDDNYFTTRSMDVYITKLRKYLKDDKSIEIVNVHGSGFRLIES